MSDDNNKIRNAQWFAVAAFSTIALVAMTVNLGKISNQTQAVKWAVSGVSIALSLSGMAHLSNYFLRDKFSGTVMDGGLALLTAGFWAATLPAIMHPPNDLAVSSYSGGIINQNLYFFSWAALIMSFIVLFGYFSQRFGKQEGEGEGGDSDHQRPMLMWGILVVTSFVVMVAAIRDYDMWKCDTSTPTGATGLDVDAVCERTEFAIALGVISAIVAFICMIACKLMKGRWGSILDAFSANFLLIFWTFGVAYLTFNTTKSPALQLGNLYFFTWGSWVLLVLMVVPSVQTVMSGKETTTEEIKDEQGDGRNEPAAVEEADVELNAMPTNEPVGEGQA